MEKVDQYELLLEYEVTRDQHRRLYEFVSRTRDAVKKDPPPLNDMVNLIYVLRELLKFNSDTYKELNSLKELLEQVTCVLHTKQSVSDPNFPNNVKTGLATGTPDVTLKARLPTLKREPANFKKLMKFFGVDPDIASRDLFRPYWPHVQEYVSNLAAEGKPLPPGVDVDKTYAAYSVRIVSRADLDELLRSLDEQHKALRKESSDNADTKFDELVIMTFNQQRPKNRSEDEDV